MNLIHVFQCDMIPLNFFDFGFFSPHSPRFHDKLEAEEAQRWELLYGNSGDSPFTATAEMHCEKLNVLDGQKTPCFG